METKILEENINPKLKQTEFSPRFKDFFYKILFGIFKDQGQAAWSILARNNYTNIANLANIISIFWIIYAAF